MSSPIRLVRSIFTVGGWTMLSRVAGLVRDQMIGAFLGATPAADAFLQAFSLPNMFRRFFAEGAFNTAFVPLFSKKLETGDDPKTFAQDAFSGLACILILLTLVAQLAMPALIFAIASGFWGDARFDMAVFYGRICFPYILFISLAALLSGVLNAAGKFAAAAAAPVLLNATLVSALFATSFFDIDVAYALSWGVVLAGIAQCALVWKAAADIGFRLTFTLPRLTPDLRKLAVIALPAFLAGGVMQINLLVGRNVASGYDGAISWLYYADRLNQLPLGVVGIAIGIVLLPDLSRRLRADDPMGSQNAFNRAMEFALLLTLPCAVALIVIPEPLISVLFERNKFTATDTAQTAMALAIYGIGLPVFVMQKVLQPLYFAREDTKTPFRYAVVAMVINVVLAIGLSPYIGFLAAAVATSLSAILMAILLFMGTRAMGLATEIDAGLKRSVPRVIAATGIMAIALYGAELFLHNALHTSGLRYAALVVLVGVGVCSYFGACFLFGALTKSGLRSLLKR